jgi:AraC-like DNA-binding protein
MPYEWNKIVQEMLDRIDVHISCFCDGTLSLEAISRKMGYSPFYATRQFHKHVGLRFRDYLRLRKLAYAAIELRDTTFNVLNISLRFGFNSQEAFTRAFKNVFGVTPGQYRKQGIPLVLQTKPVSFDPFLLGLGETSMNKKELQKVKVYSTQIPGHLFLHIKNYKSDGYFDFWEKQENVPGQDCKTICGLLDSIKGKLDGSDAKIGVFSGQVMGFLNENGKKAEAYGVRLPADWKGVKPDRMHLIEVMEGEYMVFEHPPFDYETIGESVCAAVMKAAKEFEFEGTEYRNDDVGRVGYFYYEPDRYLKILKPVKRR